MPLTSNPLDTAGNIPLILLACDGDNAPDFYHPYARVSFVTGTTRPCIASTDLKNVTTPAQARHFAVWLPTPTITGQATLRNISIAWDTEMVGGIPSPPTLVRGPLFQVFALSQPQRPANGETRFSNFTALTGTLNVPAAAVDTDDGDGVKVGTQLTQITNIKTPAEAGLAPDSVCYLQVTMPLRTYGPPPTKTIFRLLGVGLDQW